MSKADPDISDGSDDEDYKPENDDACPASEEDTDDASDSSENEASKGKQPRKKRRRKDNGAEDKEEFVTTEEEKKRSDALWADFLSDVEPPAKREVSTRVKTPPPMSESAQSREKRDEKQPLEQIFNFAGEEVKVPVESAQKATKRPQPAALARSSRSSGGLSSILGSIGKTPKMGTLEKSKLDWDSFKKNEGINEELATFNKGKDGYLERQDFLERTDYRQFDRERDMRQKKRSTR